MRRRRRGDKSHCWKNGLIAKKKRRREGRGMERGKQGRENADRDIVPHKGTEQTQRRKLHKDG